MYAFKISRSWGSYQSTVCSPWSMVCPSTGWPDLTRLRTVSCSTSCWCGWWFTAAEPWLCSWLRPCPPCRPQPSWATPCSPCSIWPEDLSSALRICGSVRRQIYCPYSLSQLSLGVFRIQRVRGQRTAWERKDDAGCEMFLFLTPQWPRGSLTPPSCVGVSRACCRCSSEETSTTSASETSPSTLTAYMWVKNTVVSV